MNEIENESEQSTGPISRFPKKSLIWTGIVAVILLVLFTQAYQLNEMFNMNPAVPGLAVLLLGLITVIVWACWAFFSAKSPLVGAFILLIPIGFFVLYIPNFKGDANISGFKPRFWSRNANLIEPATDPNLVDLKTTTPNDFPEFLGPNRNGQLENIELADSWATTPEEVWRFDIGEGWSGFVVVNGNAITQEQRGADECVTCYNVETGELKWIYKAERRHEDTMAMGKVGPRATPTVHDGLVYAIGGTGVLDCLDGSNGELIWSADIPRIVAIDLLPKNNSLGFGYSVENSSLLWGRSGSPLIVGDKVVVPGGGPVAAPASEDPPRVSMIAFDKKDGTEIWRGGNRMIGYGSPSLATVGGKQQILLVTETDAVGHDPETGEELWSHEWYGFSSSAANCSQVTFVDDQHLILSKGYNQGGELISVTNEQGKWKVENKKRDPTVLKTKFTNPVVVDGHAYSLSDGYLECVDAKTFERKWKQRGRFGNGQILRAGDKLLVHSESGTLFLVKVDPEAYKELGKFKTIKGICWNTICLYGDLILVRSEEEAACFRLPLAGDGPTEPIKSESGSN